MAQYPEGFEKFTELIMGEPFKLNSAQRAIAEQFFKPQKCWDCGKMDDEPRLRILRTRYGMRAAFECRACWDLKETIREQAQGC